jgi:hypothetical protein
MNNGKINKKTITAKTTKKNGAKKTVPTFKIDTSPAAKAMSKAFAMTQKRLHGDN